MKFSEQWLRQHINPELTTQQLTDHMTMIGLSIESATPVAGKFNGVVIGEVLSAKQHPNADKLTCCEVSIGNDQPLKIVCGAPNARAGIKVAVATVGAILPGDFKIKEAKLRGELSQGMLCSAKELQLQMGHTHFDGIIELPLDATVGCDFNTYFTAQDHIIDVEITPNRGDCLSIRGVARDIAASLNMNIALPTFNPNHTDQKNNFISVSAVSQCPRYVGRIIRNIDNTRQTPSFIQHCLQRAGIRLINPVVDICNFVMLEIGQPMHAFDLSAVKNKISVRCANHENIKLLDERTIKLSTDDVVIADDEKVLALAGIMGGFDSAVSENTTNIFLEAAFFEPKTIVLSKRRHNINTDSSYRFERGVDFNLPPEAIERASQLILEIVGGETEEIIEIVSSEYLPKRDQIILEKNQIHRILGIEIHDEKIESILKSLGMIVSHSHSHSHSHFTIIPPSYRFDMTLPIDLIEELARITGYNSIPAALMQATLNMQSYSEAAISDKRIRQFFVDRDYHEAMTYSFIDPAVYQLFSSEKPITLKNPLSQDMSVMRSSILPGLLQTIQMNVRYQCERVRLFEMGLCFLADAQPAKLAIAVTGSLHPEQWSEKKRSVDFYDLKSDVEALLKLAHIKNYEWKTGNNSTLHPGRSAALYCNQELVGWLGEVHPEIANYFDLRQSVIVCEIDLTLIKKSTLVSFKSFSKFPSVRRDIAIVLNESISAAQIRELIMKEAGEQLKEIQIFDVYQGKGIEPGKKSIALGLTFQDQARTLVDEEINTIIHHVVAALERTMEATLRA